MGMTLTAVAEQQHPSMPDFAQGTAGFAHTVDSAVHVLDALGISESRLILRMAGPGRSSLQIIRQSPSAGTALTPSTTVTLWIAGFGYFESLPLPMRESGGEAEIGTRELSQLFDDPIQKAAQWLRAGAPLFRIGPEKVPACRRWLALFGVDTTQWPDELLWPLALLAPTLARMAGREVGIKLAFLVLLGLPIHRIRHREAYRLLDPQERSLLGAQSSRLGCDFVVGDRQLDTDAVIIQLGPVSLDVYSSFQAAQGRQLIRMTTDLCTSIYQNHSITWMLEDARQIPRLGVASKNSCIGLNFHLGRGARA